MISNMLLHKSVLHLPDFKYDLFFTDASFRGNGELLSQVVEGEGHRPTELYSRN